MKPYVLFLGLCLGLSVAQADCEYSHPDNPSAKVLVEFMKKRGRSHEEICNALDAQNQPLEEGAVVRNDFREMFPQGQSKVQVIE